MFIFVMAYTNSTFMFAGAPSTFALYPDRGIVASQPMTVDGGKTRMVDWILIPGTTYEDFGCVTA